VFSADDPTGSLGPYAEDLPVGEESVDVSASGGALPGRY